ncbi:carbohydrate ABC transporter permease [Brucella pseudogrignonensis]|jgi:raffinose/stachyose/melibiose transport system permease protein|uniref:carbohydrate ABC transporter permease n=1 Tax=Brucella pseudogrignonensis TaxID=419475 RepID=UPI0002BB6A59|nr:carbohydrate ABC transporter permease [Brucella pseudogrignonensis]EMG51595.1 ABC sugar transporter, inner membrane subunit [Ochrobactrum sp. CDB2]ANG99392.1 ABC transporter permease [Brucella pseudogrignonensis]PQZ39253.1 carbohydrate ABC transporter permease [Brucella pseudogrignonensis]PRA35893.1 carbohydrate ABC transporter permease [Brucella pseudogrignonensis]PRA62964.1 carbohydrate ABC transporter permease [Brucella pseudogrignonensis]
MSEASYQPRDMQSINFVQTLVRVCLVTFLISLGVVVIYPLLWMALNGFKTNSEIFGEPFALPTGFTLDNYISAWNQGIRNYIATSIIVTLVSAVCTVLISAWTAFGLTRSKLPGKPFFVGLVLGGLMLSPTVAVIPLVRIMQKLGLYNTYWALIILYTAFRIPFTTFLIRAYMLGLPRDLDEAAVMDGASEGQIFWRVTLPLCKPILVSCVILHVLFAWNEYLFAMIFTSGADVQTLPVGLTSIMAKHGTNYAIVFAAMTLSALPILIVFFAAQRFFIRGLAEGIGK